MFFTIRVNELPQTIQTARQPLAATASDNGRYPFSYRLTDWFCSEAGTTRTLHLPAFPCGRIGKCSFHYISIVVTSTGFVGEGRLATLSRLA
jgi:hypothetical protein